jgi:antiviral defense system Shedu protein SduA
MNYRDLEWIGPVAFRDIRSDVLPDAPGLYVFTNSRSPFAFGVSGAEPLQGARSAADPQVLYAGFSSSLRHRVQQHSVSATSPLSTHSFAEGVFLYWAETADGRNLERQLIEDYYPLFNRYMPPRQKTTFDAAVQRLEQLLRDRITDEAEYQQYFQDNPWVFGFDFKIIEAHRKFDDENIPDFTGVRSRDDSRDIVEIKQPFLQLVRADGTPTTDFHAIWSQAERYLVFARQEQDYLLRRKNLRFDNPYCYLIFGVNLGERLREEIKRERHEGRILIINYWQ